jgi:D-galactarolactone isomerase
MSDKPKLKAPPGACDCHIHIYEDRYPLAPTATFKPPHAPVAEYREVQKALGLERVIVVQPTAYGFDNSCTLDAMKALGPGARGVSIIPSSVSALEIQQQHEKGIRGVRYFMLPGGVLGWDTLDAMAAKIKPFGWYINLQLDGRELPKHVDQLKRLPVPLMIDHTGKFLEPVGVGHAAFKALLGLLDNGRTYCKIAAPYETSRTGKPGYQDVGALARALIKANPERIVWASNWPHPNQDPRPSSAAMLDLLLEWADSDATRKKILVDNPARLFGF